MDRYDQTIKALERHMAGQGNLSNAEVETAYFLLINQRTTIVDYQHELRRTLGWDPKEDEHADLR